MSDVQAEASAVRREFGELADLLDVAMRQPGIDAVPDVMAALNLVAAGLMRLAGHVARIEENRAGDDDG